MTFSQIFIYLCISNLFVEIQGDRSTVTHHNQTCPLLLKTLADCDCSYPNTIACSSSTSLTQLPRSWRSTNHNLTSFTQSIRRFDLVHIPLLSLMKTDDFQGLSNLQTLFIINTGVKTIRAHAFRHLPNLKELRIESNRNLTELNSFSLSNLHHVHRISLTSNSIRVIRTEAFRNSHFINTIDLSNNPLEIIESYAFTGLKSIGKLILCILSNCSIKQIDPFAFFGLQACDNIQLTGIETSINSNSFSHMSSIGSINFSNSDIVAIESFAFQGCEHLTEIDFSSSMISKLSPNAFNEVFNISLLNLQGNLIRIFDESTFLPLTKSIKQINLDNNPIQCDCSLEWFLEERSDRFKLPDVCTGPIGYECLSPNELQRSQLPCYQQTDQFNQTQPFVLCEKRDSITVVTKSNVSRRKQFSNFLIYFIMEFLFFVSFV